MTGKEINTNATGILVLILPFAFLIVLLFKAWPVLLALLVLSITMKLWQQYQWEQWSKRVNPYFNQLIQENQGCLTPIDLAMKANLSGLAAQQYLDKKAEEFGAQLREYEGKGKVYYFLTASSFGSLFDDSEPPLELEAEAEDVDIPASVVMEPLIDTEPNPSHDESSTIDDNELSQPDVEQDDLHQPDVEQNEFSHPDVEQEVNSSVEVNPTDTVEADLEPLEQQQPEYKQDSWQDAADDDEEKKLSFQPLIQGELAKRLDVHSSTVGKRKTDEDFPEWSQSRDPEGIAWTYNPKSKEFVPVDKIPEPEL